MTNTIPIIIKEWRRFEHCVKLSQKCQYGAAYGRGSPDENGKTGYDCMSGILVRAPINRDEMLPDLGTSKSLPVLQAICRSFDRFGGANTTKPP